MENNVVQLDWNRTTTTDDSTNTGYVWIEPSTGTQTISWYPNYYPQKDEVAELKAWIDGFMTGRKLTEGNLKKVQDKLDEFTRS